jgi:hypothetical protein
MIDLFTIHAIYITLCVSCCWWAGYSYGCKTGTRKMLNLLIEDKLVTQKQLENTYGK